MMNVYTAILIKWVNVNITLDLNGIIFIVYTALPYGEQKPVTCLKSWKHPFCKMQQ